MLTYLTPAKVFMAHTTTSALVDELRQLRLLESAQLEETARLQERYADPKDLVRELLARDWLTGYQANQLLTGKGHQLLLGANVLLDRLGEGGMGQVFKARQRSIGRVVAIKVIRKERVANPDALKRFLREVRAAAALSHPNIVRAFDADEVAGIHILVMECVEGAIDLHRLVRSQGPLPIALACDCIRQAALGLQHAHERGLVHRDIKPHNLLLTGALRTKEQLAAGTHLVKILDMGLARRTSTGEGGAEAGDSSGSMTMEGTFLGTPDYTAPEQALDSHNVDCRSDLYSLGCTLYFLLTGDPPFKGGTLMQKVLRHQQEEAPPIESLRPDVPPAVGQIVRTLLAKRPEQRYQTPGELADALAAVAAGVSPLGVSPLPANWSANAAFRAAEPEAARDTVNSAFAFMAGAGVQSGAGVAAPGMAMDDTAEDSEDSPTEIRRQKLVKRGVVIGAASATVIVVGAALALWLGGYFSHTDKPKERHVKPIAVAPPVKPVVPKAVAQPAAGPLGGKWHYIGPFDNRNWSGFDTAYPPEKDIDLAAVYDGKNGQKIAWKELTNFQLGVAVDFVQLFPDDSLWGVVYLYHEMDVAEAADVPISLGSDDTLSVWLNGERLLHRRVYRVVRPNDDIALLRLRPGKNRLLVKVCQGIGAWGFYVSRRVPFFYEEPGFAAWVEKTAALAGQAQVDEVIAKLRDCNPGYQGEPKYAIENDTVISLSVRTDAIADLSPLAALKNLKRLECHGSAPGKGILVDLTPLRGLTLEYINCGWTNVWDLSPLKGAPLTLLGTGQNRVTDLSVIAGMKLHTLWIHHLQLSAPPPVAGMGVKVVNMESASGVSLATFQGMPLERVQFSFERHRDLPLLRSFTTLQQINGKPAAEFLAAADLREATLRDWRRTVADLPAEQQAAAVAAKLVELNPGFDGKFTHMVEGTDVVEFGIVTDLVTDIEPIGALTKLKKLDCNASDHKVKSKLATLEPLRGLPLTWLHCGRNQVSDLRPLAGMQLENLYCAFSNVRDLTPLKGMPLVQLQCHVTPVGSLAPLADSRQLKILDINNTQVHDLKPLKDCPLTTLDCVRTQVTDLSPLQAAPLADLRCDSVSPRDADILRAVKTLKKINGKNAADVLR